MADRRTVDELSVEELERVLLLKRRALRQKRLHRLREMGRIVDDPVLPAQEGVEADIPSADREAEGGAQLSVGAELFRWDRDACPEASGPGSQMNREEKWPRETGGAYRRGARVRDRLLLVLEVSALIGLVVILVGSLSNLKMLNEEVAQAREVPTPTATPLIQVSVLPGGSSPPARGSDVPAAYQNLVRKMPSLEMPTPAPQRPTRIVIPAIKLDAPVVHGDSWEDLKKGVGHHIGSVNPGERGNMILSAHNDVFGEIFRYLEDVELEDEVIVYSGRQAFEYIVKAKRVVEPTDVSVMAPTSKPVLTMITCYPYLIDTHRLVVIAELKG